MDQVENYFNAEKFESLFFMAVGLLAIGISAYLLIRINQPFYNGISYAFISIAFIQIVVGTSVYFRSPKDIKRVNHLIEVEKQKIQLEEIPRMEVVMKNFVIYRWIEIALMLTGLLLFYYFGNTTKLKGVGLGLLIQAGIMLFLDYFAEGRGKVYLAFLNSLH